MTGDIIRGLFGGFGSEPRWFWPLSTFIIAIFFLWFSMGEIDFGTVWVFRFCTICFVVMAMFLFCLFYPSKPVNLP